MRAGALRRRIVVEARSGAQDAMNQPLDDWTTVVTTYADIQPASGRETLAGEALVSAITSVIEIRYRTNVTANMRARYGSRVFNIEAVIDVDTTHETLRLLCTEGMNQG